MIPEMTEMPPKSTVGVVVPTLDCVHLLRDHLDSMGEWLDMVDQIVVVDSYSSDGTWQMLQGELKGPKTSFHQLPRGLYQSWNYGVDQLTTDFAYFSTIGDGISRSGLANLQKIAVALQADVVISPPEFVEEDGRASDFCPHWPIHEIIRTQQIAEPALIDSWILLLLCLENPVDAILGSSASNLYRTSLLQKKHFPTDYGTVGDGAWGLANIFDYRLAVTPECSSSFRKHQKAYSAATYEVADLNRRLFNVLLARLDQITGTDSQRRQHAELLECSRLAGLVGQRMTWQARLEAARRMRIPWLANPYAWYARNRRNHYRREARELRDAGLTDCRRKPASDESPKLINLAS